MFVRALFDLGDDASPKTKIQPTSLNAPRILPKTWDRTEAQRTEKINLLVHLVLQTCLQIAANTLSSSMTVTACNTEIFELTTNLKSSHVIEDFTTI
jgi:hypothetical protein